MRLFSNNQCSSLLGCGGQEAVICQSCYTKACRAVASLRRLAENKGAKRHAYGQRLRRQIEQQDALIRELRWQLKINRGVNAALSKKLELLGVKTEPLTHAG